MDFSFTDKKRLYKEYISINFLPDNLKYKKCVDLEQKEFIKLFLLMREYIEMNSLNIEVIE